MDRGHDWVWRKRSIRRQVTWALHHPESMGCDIHTHFRTIYGRRSPEYVYFLAYLSALETFEPITLSKS